jgi:hypothetical protein
MSESLIFRDGVEHVRQSGMKHMQSVRDNLAHIRAQHAENDGREHEQYHHMDQAARKAEKQATDEHNSE